MRNIGQGEDSEYQWDENDDNNGSFNMPGDTGFGSGGGKSGGVDATQIPGVEGDGGPTSGKEGTGYSPRENFLPGGGGNESATTSTPRKPSTPDIRSGQVSNYSGPDSSGGGGVVPFAPLGSGGAMSIPPISSGPIGQPGAGRSQLFGRAGGLQGGGLGAPGAGGSGFDQGDTTSIEALIASLMRKKRGLF